MIRLNPALLPRYAQNANVDLDVLSKKSGRANGYFGIDRAGFDPASTLLENLKVTFSRDLLSCLIYICRFRGYTKILSSFFMILQEEI